MDTANIRRALEDFDFARLFISCLGWSNPHSQARELNGVACREIARIGPIPALLVQRETIPDAAERQKIATQIAKVAAENVIVWSDEAQTQCVLAWRKRSHVYIKGQPSELFVSKLTGLMVELSDYAEGDLTVIAAAKKIKQALDTSKVTTKFYHEWKEIQIEIAPMIEGLPDDKTRAQYSLVLLHRLMFVYFLQKRGFVDENRRYLENKIENFGGGAFFQSFLKPLFFEGFAQPEAQRSPATKAKIGDVKYLNGGLFLPHPLEREFPGINAPDIVFEKILKVFGDYDWFADDSRDSSRGLLSPELLGFIFEKFINDQKSAGAYYTPEALTSYLCERTIEDLILDEVKIYAGSHARRADSVFDLIGHADAALCGAVWERLSNLRVLDPAVGSGAFLVAAFYTLADVYAQLWGRAERLGLKPLQQAMMGDDVPHASPFYAMYRRIITHNLYGVDLMEGAPEIARLRLFLALVSSARTRDELEPLPNIDFNILEGNSLIGMTGCDEADFVGGGLFVKAKFDELAHRKSNLIRQYKNADESIRPQLAQMRHDANALRKELRVICDEATVAHWNALGIKRAGHGKIKIGIRESDIAPLRPFHWGAEFPEAMERGGFDAIITNPPWEVFKPNGKEFLQTFSQSITKKTMSIKEFETEKDRLIADPHIKAQWEAYLAQFPYVSEYFRKSPDYLNQISVVNGKKAGTDINLYKLFVERCFDLLQPNGRCGIVIPSGIYTDLGAKQLREMLFAQTQITGLFGISNEKNLFDGVHHALRFCALTWAKGKTTEKFPAAFRINPSEAVSNETLPDLLYNKQSQIEVSTDLVRKLSPDSLSIMEFRNDEDLRIAQKMLQFPLLGEQIEGKWNLKLANEFHMTGDSNLYQTSGGEGLFPLIEGKCFWQFDNEYAPPKYWVSEKDARERLARKQTGETFDYENYRVAFRDVSPSSNIRTVIATVLAPNRFCPHTVTLEKVGVLSNQEKLYLAAIFNSFVYDSFMRKQCNGHVSFFYVYNSPVPRLTSGDAEFEAIVSASAKLICTTPAFDELAREAGLRSHADGVAAPDERAALRAGLDARIARLYGLDESEFAHILATFPLVEPAVKDAAINAFRDLE